MFTAYSKKSVVLATLFFCLVAAGCGRTDQVAQETVSFEGGIMGTTYHITVVGTMSDDESTECAQFIEAALKHVDIKMSTYRSDSELSAFNAAPGNVPITLSDETFNILDLALKVNKKTEGAFDITVGPLVNAWGFGPDAFEDAPSDEELSTLRKYIGPDKLVLDENSHTVTKSDSAVYCDLSGIAKGYAVDVVEQLLHERGFDSVMVEIGGEVRCSGLNDEGVPWRIAIEKPVSEGRLLHEIVGLQDISLATSGNYRNFVEVDGKRMSHTIDPNTGRPVEHNLASVSVLHVSCTEADAYATALMVLGPERGMTVAKRLNLPVMFVMHGENGEFVTKQTESFRAFVVK